MIKALNNNKSEVVLLKEKALQLPLKKALNDYREVITIIKTRGVKAPRKITKALNDIGLKFTAGQVEYYLRKNPITEVETENIKKLYYIK